MTKKIYQIEVTYDDNGVVTLNQYDKDFTPFELLGLISHVKNDIEVALLKMQKNEQPKKHKISELDISVRAHNILNAMGIKYLEDISYITKTKFIETRGVGIKSIQEIEELMLKYNVKYVNHETQF
jgi:DNA-directed RNA polymerase alpha subunit